MNFRSKRGEGKGTEVGSRGRHSANPVTDFADPTGSCGVRTDPSALLQAELKYFILPWRLFNIRSGTPRRREISGVCFCKRRLTDSKAVCQQSFGSWDSKSSLKGGPQKLITHVPQKSKEFSLSPPNVGNQHTLQTQVTQSNPHRSWLHTVDPRRDPAFLPTVPS